MTTERIDVLAVMDASAEKITFLAQKTGVYHPATELAEARAAVAELIEDRDRYKFMFYDAVRALAEIDSVLGVESDGCNDPQNTVSALLDYMAGVARGFDSRDVCELIYALSDFLSDEPIPTVSETVDQLDRLRNALARVGGTP